MVGTRGRFYPLASSHTHTGLRDTVNTKLDGAFSFVIYDYYEECAEETETVAVSQPWVKALVCSCLAGSGHRPVVRVIVPIISNKKGGAPR